jgi:Domain of unknown function (DUF4917)
VAKQFLTFAQALKRSDANKRHLLLGNGFSIAWKSSAFSYGSLRDKADLSAMSCDGDELFRVLGTNDFEQVIEGLKAVEKILPGYDPDSGIGGRIASDADVIREALATALAAKHPDNVGVVSTAQYGAARSFLRHFDRVYSVNYDLLLYWCTLQETDELEVVGDDGFRADPDDPDAEWVTWDNIGSRSTQDVHYLHGALHLFDAGDRLKKLTWIRTSVPLLDQIRFALDRGEYPLVVTEGSSAEKLARLDHSAYLSGSYRSFGNIGGDLFIHGHSLSANDEHILEAIVRSKVSRIFVSLHGNPESQRNRGLRRRAQQLVDKRSNRSRGKKSLALAFYDSGSARVWGERKRASRSG